MVTNPFIAAKAEVRHARQAKRSIARPWRSQNTPPARNPAVPNCTVKNPNSQIGAVRKTNQNHAVNKRALE
jgi:hypothetical protein